MRSELKSPDKALLINPEWRVITDDANYIIQKRRVTAKESSKNFGNEYWYDWACHHRLSDVFSSLAEQFTRDNWFDVERILKAIEELSQKIAPLTAYKQQGAVPHKSNAYLSLE